MRLVQSGTCRVILGDVHLPGIHAYEFLDRLLRVDPGVHVIIITKEDTLESALEAIRRGATDFLPKPLAGSLALEARARRCGLAVRPAEAGASAGRATAEGSAVSRHRRQKPGDAGSFDFARKVARHYTNVLLVGPTGTEKELVARAIHQLSPVSQHRLAVCNCSAMVDTLLDSQLFGHVRGAFTGATEMRPGMFEYADGGTVSWTRWAKRRWPCRPSCCG